MQIALNWGKQYYCRFQYVSRNAFHKYDINVITQPILNKPGEIHIRHTALCSQVLLATVTPKVN